MKKMSPELKKMPEFAALLQLHRDEIITQWANQVHKIPDAHYQQFGRNEIIQWAFQGLDAIVQAFTSGSTKKLDAYLKEITFSRLEEGFHIYEVTEALLLAKEAILPVLWRSFPTDSPNIMKMIAQLDACLRYMIRYFGYLFSEVTHRQLLDETNKRLVESESIKRTMAALLQHLTLDEVLEIVCSEAKHLTNATGSAILLRDGTWLQVTFSTGNPSPALERLPIEDSLAGLVIQQEQPMLVNDPANQVHAYRRNPDLLSLLVIPLHTKELSIGVIDVVNKPGGFTNDDIRIMSLFADQAAIAIENARLHHQTEELAIVRERQRLARDLHDSVTQTMYSLYLYIDATRRALQGNQVDKAIDHLAELQNMVREVMLDLRLLIFELHPPILQKEGLAAALKTRLESVEARSGIHTEYNVFEERRLPLETETELYRIAQEALTNVVKHARADHVSVSLQYHPDKFKLKVQDNGIGFDSEEARTSGGLGLKSIQGRVQRMNGLLTIEGTPQTGTTLEVTIDI
jgi:signal transduction histidine kinase